MLNKNKLISLIGTIIFSLIVVLLLLMLSLKTQLPLPDEAGVEVNIGNSDIGYGNVQLDELSDAKSDLYNFQENKIETKNADDNVVTDNSEEINVSKPVIKNVKPENNTTPIAPKIIKEQKPIVENPQPTVNPKAMFKGSGSSKQNTAEGIFGGEGNQGQPDGSGSSSNYQGHGGAGGGVSFSLSGRSSKALPSPSKSFNEKGIVVVAIFVNQSGKVTRVQGGARGSTTTSLKLIKLAEDAAKKATFSAKQDAPDEQKGTITYIFELN